MKRTLLCSILAMVSAALLPLAGYCQIAPEKSPSQSNEPANKYEVFVGWGYTSINQVTLSRSGLQGVSLSATRNWGKYFGVTVEGGHYAWTLTATNPETSSVDQFLAGPEFHAALFGPISMFAHGLMGAVHTGDVSIQPTTSFAGGVGMGADYRLNHRLYLRLAGDDIASSFTITPYEPGDSPHRLWNAHAEFGVAYKF